MTDPADDIDSRLTPRQALFVREYLKDFNGARAARAAGYSPLTAKEGAYSLLQRPHIRAAVDAVKVQQIEKVEAEATEVVRMLIEVARADPNDLVESRRSCCRYCWGNGFRYQRTPGEMARDRDQHLRDQMRQQREAEREDKPFTPTAFDEAGGIGYHRHREPNAECPECFGDGELDVHVQDSRLLQGAARRLYAGVKRTKDGIEVKMRDQDKAVEMLGRHLALFTDKFEDTGASALAAAIIAARRRALAPKAPPSVDDLV